MPNPLACRSTLVLGGARSGKSRYALDLVAGAGLAPWFLATAQAGDAEMAKRIARHRGERDGRWTTLEEPLELAALLRREARSDRAVLVDCLTLWLSNLMFAGRDLAAEIETLAALAAGLSGPAVFVSNEVGSGIAPATPLGREFRDWQGRANQAMAAACDTVVLVTAGLPTLLKPAPGFRLRLG